MPLISIVTNVSKDKIPANFVKETSSLVAKTLGKPESYVVTHVQPDQILAWGGDQQSPCAVVHLYCIGRLGVAENKKHSAVISTHLQKNLGIPSDKLYIFFNDSDKANIGYSGTTFHDIL